MSQLLLVAGSIVGVLGAVVIAAFGAEFRGWLPHLSRRLLLRACRRLPVHELWREEEWRADLDVFSDRPLSMVVVALRILRNARALVREAQIVALARPAEQSGLVTIGDVWDALDSAGLRPHQGALGTAYFALSDGRHAGFPNRGFFDHGIASDELLALVASWGVRPTRSGEYPMPADATPEMWQPRAPRFVKPSS